MTVERALSELLTESNERLGDRPEPVLLTLTEKNGFVPQADRFRKRLATQDTSNYKFVRRGAIAFNPYLLWAGAIAHNDAWDEAIVSPLYPVFFVREGVDPLYVWHILRSPSSLASFDRISFGSVPRRRRASVNDFLGVQVRVPDLVDQRRAVLILESTLALRRSGQRTQELMRTLRESVVALDLARARARAAITHLGELADIGSGITKGRRTSESTRPVPYLTVANVQDQWLNLAEVGEIDATEREVERYRLRRNDLLLTEGGDADKLGRGALWSDELPLSIHQNHVFKVRVRDPDQLDPRFLSAQVSSSYGKKYFLGAAKQTTGIATINATDLRSFPVIVPRIEDQRLIAGRLSEIDALQNVAAARVAKLDELFASVQYRAFRGEL